MLRQYLKYIEAKKIVKSFNDLFSYKWGVKLVEEYGHKTLHISYIYGGKMDMEDLAKVLKFLFDLKVKTNYHFFADREDNKTFEIKVCVQ